MRALELVDKHLNVAAFQIGCLCSVRAPLHPGLLITSKGSPIGQRCPVSGRRCNLIIEDSSTRHAEEGCAGQQILLPIITVVHFLHTLNVVFSWMQSCSLLIINWRKKVVIKGLKTLPGQEKPSLQKCRFRCRTPRPWESKIQSDKRGAGEENNCKTIFDRKASYNIGSPAIQEAGR
ncbi:hypothetical protein CEXT_553921 [Caerostris extrusa]|uniref:Uncharacterized protein n=1 Tax=Caerostris extrusa TaxID=172846 RepID=A0AAV4PB70_CAEEX|nr:hypothetical protein CEXT_553921 [Caerostris extrusa]